MTPKKPKVKPTGRPTSYKPEYCKMLVDHMEKGYSLESFAGLIGVSIDTVWRWSKSFELFSEAKKLGEARSRLFWERLGILGAGGKIPNFQVAAYIFNMKNRFGWRDKVDHTLEVSGKITHDLKLLEKMPTNDVIKIGKEAIEYLEAAKGDESNDQ